MVRFGTSQTGTAMTNGLLFVSEFITPDLENLVLSNLKSPTKKHEDYRNNVFRYGPKTPYGFGNLSVIIPDYLHPIMQKIVDDGISPMPQSVSVNEYLEGQKLDPHIDSQHAGPTITIVSLMSSAIMRFTKDQETFDVELTPRSLIRMQDEARYKWKHEVLPLKATRYSIVFRCV
jgi:hypothetical protein